MGLSKKKKIWKPQEKHQIFDRHCDTIESIKEMAWYRLIRLNFGFVFRLNLASVKLEQTSASHIAVINWNKSIDNLLQITKIRSKRGERTKVIRVIETGIASIEKFEYEEMGKSRW